MNIHYSVLKLTLVALAIFMLSSCGDKVVEAPNFVKSFVAEHFNGVAISRTIKDGDDNNYEVYLADGSELEFSADGTWLDIKSYNLPDSIIRLLPGDAGQQFINSQLIVYEIDRKRQGIYTVETMQDHFERIVYADGSIKPPLPIVE